MTRRATVLFLGAVLLAGPVQGQGGGCVLVTDKPAQLRGVNQYITRIQDETDRSNISEKPRHLERGLRALAELDRIENQIGRHYQQAMLYSSWLRSNAKNIKEIAVREDLGFFDNPKGTHDLYAAIDTALNKVEALNAACVDSTAVIRFRVFSLPFNKARALMNAGKFDSAEAVAKRALVVDPKSGAPWNLIAQVRQRKGDTKGYAEALEMVISSLSGDSSARTVRQQALFNLGVLNSNEAEKDLTGGPQKVETAKKSVGYFTEFLKLKPGDPQGRTALARALKLAGDSAQAYAIFKEMLTNPAQFTAIQLFSAGKDAFDAALFDDAVAFFDAGLRKNAHSRDGLFNLANTHVRAANYELAVPLIARLLAVDPVNRDNFILAGNVWKGIMNSLEDGPKKQAALDTTLVYLRLRDSSDISVRPEPFAPPATGDVTLEGVVHNWTAAQKSYSFVLEFLNAAGNAVGAAQTVEVTEIPAKTGKRFEVTGKGAGIVAYRYKPAS